MRWLVICLLPTPALGCPTATNLWTGVVLTLDDGITTFFHAESDDVVVAIQKSPAFATTTTLARGIYDMESRITGANVIGADTRSRITVPTGGLPLPSPGLPTTLDAELDSSMGASFQQKRAYTWGEPASIAIGNCEYLGLPGRVEESRDELDTISELFYLPDLGVAILTAYAVPELGLASTYTYVEVIAQ